MNNTTRHAIKEAYGAPALQLVTILAAAAAGLVPPMDRQLVGGLVHRVGNLLSAESAAIEVETFAQARGIAPEAANVELEDQAVSELVQYAIEGGIVPEGTVYPTGNKEQDNAIKGTLMMFAQIGLLRTQPENVPNYVPAPGVVPFGTGLTEEEQALYDVTDKAAQAEFERLTANEEEFAGGPVS